MDANQFQQFLAAQQQQQQAIRQLLQAQQQQQPAPQPAPVITGGVKLRTLEQNDPVEWKHFRIHFETLQTVHNWPDATARGMLRGSMTGEALKVVSDILVLPQGQTLAQMLDAYEARFTPAPHGRYARTEYEETRQLPEESAIQWHGRLRDLFQRGFPNGDAENDAGIIERFLKRHKDIRVAQNIWARDQLPQTYTAALHAVQNVEASLMLQSGPTGPQRGDTVNYIPKQNNQGQAAKGKTCFVCQAVGHFAKDCFMLDRAMKYVQESRARKGDNKDKNQRSSDGKSRQGRGRQGQRRQRGRINQIGEEEEEEDKQTATDPITLADQGN